MLYYTSLLLDTSYSSESQLIAIEVNDTNSTVTENASTIVIPKSQISFDKKLSTPRKKRKLDDLSPRSDRIRKFIGKDSKVSIQFYKTEESPRDYVYPTTSNRHTGWYTKPRILQ